MKLLPTKQQNWAVFPPSGGFSLLINLLPILGILFLNWDSYFILAVYTLETLIAGIFAAIKIGLARKDYFPLSFMANFSLFDALADRAVNFIPKPILIIKFLGWQFVCTLVVSILGFFLFDPTNISRLPQFSLLIFPAAAFTTSYALNFKNYLSRCEYYRFSSMDIFREHLYRYLLILGSIFLAFLLGHIPIVSYTQGTGIALILLVSGFEYTKNRQTFSRPVSH